ELWLRRGRDRDRLRRLRDQQRVLLLAMDFHLEMQMRARRPARHADGADARALLDPLSAAHVDAAQVRIHGRAVVAVLDADNIAVTVLPTGKIDDSVADTAHRRAGGRAIVDTVVLFPGLQDRMRAHRPARGDARELPRAAQERLALA